ncbi:MAG: hypothetical protein AAGB00_05905 [Planctomycetota bacterium]
MVDRQARQQLSQALRQLISGRITNDEFEDRWPPPSEDAALDGVQYFGWLLYSDTHAYKLRGRLRVVGRERQQGARAVLFLRTGLAYEWPEWPGATWGERFFSCMIALFGLLGAFAWWNDAHQNAWFARATIAYCSFVGGSMLFSWLWHRFGPAETQQIKEYKQAGDYEVWPFLRRADFERACREHHLLAR